MADQQFCLRWNNHQSTLISVFDTLLLNGTLVDCTLAAEGQYLKAHKVVLSACSPYLESLLSQHFEKHPIVILKDVKFSELKSMMDYMYRGEVNISQDQLGTFLKAAESLQIKGLSDNGADGDARDVGSTPKAPPPRKANVPAPSNRPEPVRPDSPLTDGSMSPSSRKRRRVRRSSQDDDNHLESNSCDLPSQAQSTPVPNIPASSSITTTPIVKPAIVKPEQTDVNRIDSNSLPLEVLKKEIEPISEPLIEPKTEYLEDVNNEDSVEDLTLDDDDDMEGMDISNMSNMSNMSRPGPSHGNDISNQSFTAWNLGANQSGTDEVFMAAQEAVNQHRDSQGKKNDESQLVSLASLKGDNYIVYFQCSNCTLLFTDEETHAKHICSAKPIAISIIENPKTLTPEKFESLNTDSCTNDFNKENLLTVKREDNLTDGEEDTNPVESTLKENEQISVNSPEKENTTDLKAIVICICSKCKTAFKDLDLYEKHPCVIKKLEGEEISFGNDKSLDKELIYQCPRCERFYLNFPAFFQHPCLEDKTESNPVEETHFVSVEEDDFEMTFSLKSEPGSQDNSREPFSCKNGIESSSTVLEKELSEMEERSSETPVLKKKRGKVQTPTPWKCSVCHKYFKQRYYLINHACVPPSKNPLPYGALGKPPFTCPKCGKKYKHKQSFCRHLHHECKATERPKKIIPPIRQRQSKTPESSKVREFQCEKCKKYFDRKYYLIHHSCDPPSMNPLPRGSLGNPPYLCSGCGVVYKHKQSYCRHIHHECGKGRKFFKKSNGRTKKDVNGQTKKNASDQTKEDVTGNKTKAKKTTQPTHKCVLCNTEFQDQYSLEVHVQLDHLTL